MKTDDLPLIERLRFISERDGTPTDHYNVMQESADRLEEQETASTRSVTQDQAVAILRSAAETETQKCLAARLDISPQYLCDVLGGRRDPEHVLHRFGYERVVTYRKRVIAKAEGRA